MNFTVKYQTATMLKVGPIHSLKVAKLNIINH